jgi:hypothetical protein
MDTQTQMALDAFRENEVAKAEQYEAEGRSQRAARLVPYEDKPLYIFHTALIKYEVMAEQSRKADDNDGYNFAREQCRDLRQQIANLERKEGLVEVLMTPAEYATALRGGPRDYGREPE